jgi:hypothetical protein
MFQSLFKRVFSTMAGASSSALEGEEAPPPADEALTPEDEAPTPEDESPVRKRRKVDDHAASVPQDARPSLAEEKPICDPKKKKAGIPYKRQRLDPDVLQTRRKIQLCCKSNDLAKAWGLYKEAEAKNITIEPQTYFCLLGLCDGFGDRGLHIGTPRPPANASKTKVISAEADGSDKAKNGSGTERRREIWKGEVKDDSEISVEERQKYAFEIKEQVDQKKTKMNETAYTALVRVMCKGHTLKGTLEAEEVLEQAISSPQQTVTVIKPKLRLFSSLLLSWTEQRNMTKVIQLWQKIIDMNQPQLKLTEKEYCAILKCATAVGDTGVFGRVLAELAEDVLVPSRDTTRAIEDWFSSSASRTNPPAANVLEDNPLKSITVPTMGPVVMPAAGEDSTQRSWSVSRGSQIDVTTGELQDGCLKGARLEAVQLSPEDRKAMMDMNDTIVKHDGLPQDTSQYAGGGKGRKKRADQPLRRQKHWSAFSSWLQKTTGPVRDVPNAVEDSEKRPFDVILDAANIGYFKQNYGKAPKHVDYQQIDWIVRRFTEAPENKRVLVVLHERHFSPTLMPIWARPIVDRWQQTGASSNVSLYKAPAGCNDDWFWLHAGLWCGKQCMVVTNDEMRDHHFQMLSHGSFLRWKERHQIRFEFGDWEDAARQEKNGGRKERRRQVILQRPDVYSRRIQRLEQSFGLVVPLPKRGDENRFLDGDFVSTADPFEETYVCIAATDGENK